MYNWSEILFLMTNLFHCSNFIFYFLFSILVHFVYICLLVWILNVWFRSEWSKRYVHYGCYLFYSNKIYVASDKSYVLANVLPKEFLTCNPIEQFKETEFELEIE